MTNPDADIAGFHLGGLYCLDSYAPFQVEWRGKLYPTAEHAFQAAHFFETAPDLAEQVRRQRSPRLADEFANRHRDQDQPNWRDIRVEVMREICRVKLEQHELIRETLSATGNRRIVEMNDADAFWGWGPDRSGRNMLGEIWMALRADHA